MTFIFPLFWKIHKWALLGIWSTFLLGVTLHYFTTRLQNVLLTMTQETRGKCRDKGYTANLISTFYEGRKVRVTVRGVTCIKKTKAFPQSLRLHLIAQNWGPRPVPAAKEPRLHAGLHSKPNQGSFGKEEKGTSMGVHKHVSCRKEVEACDQAEGFPWGGV